MTREIMELDEQNPPADQQPENQPPNPTTPTNEFEKLIQQTLGESERARIAAEQRARELEDQLNSQKQQQQQQPQQLPEAQAYWNNPVETINKLIEQQMKPLTTAAQQLTQQSAYENLKAQYRLQYPAFAQIEKTVDQMMQGLEPTHKNMQIAIQRAVGHLVMTNPALLNQQAAPNNSPPASNNTPAPQNVPPQAHLRPSNNSPEKREDLSNKKHPPLTENVKRMLREQNMTEERYWELMEKPIQVESWKPEGKK